MTVTAYPPDAGLSAGPPSIVGSLAALAAVYALWWR
jgi:hypothetical protein